MAGVVHVAVAPKEPLEAGIVEKVAAIVKKDLHETRLVLGWKIPRIVGHYQSLSVAESVAESLKALGLVAIVCHDSEIRQPSSARFRAHTLKLKEGEIAFWDRGRQERVIAAERVFLILKGTVQTQVQRETTRTKTELNLAATVMTGGIPVMRKVKVEEKTKDQSRKTEDFVRLYGWTSPEPMVEIFQNDFDYSSLDKKKAFSSLENINIIVAELRSTFPAAVFDARLTRHFKVDVPFTSPQDEIEINSKLIYLCHRAVSGPGPAA
jgi:hypothetical protein